MKRKDYNEIINKIVSVEPVLSRGQRIPSLELIFKENGYNRLSGHKIYIDYKCAKELLQKLDLTIREVETKYFPHEFYERLSKALIINK